MLTEAKRVFQHAGEPFRRFFSDERLELSIWLDTEREIIGFELAYHHLGHAHALRWQAGSAVEQYAVDEGGWTGVTREAMILRPCSTEVDSDLGREFACRSGEIEPSVARFVQAKLDAYLAEVGTLLPTNWG